MRTTNTTRLLDALVVMPRPHAKGQQIMVTPVPVSEMEGGVLSTPAPASSSSGRRAPQLPLVEAIASALPIRCVPLPFSLSDGSRKRLREPEPARAADWHLWSTTRVLRNFTEPESVLLGLRAVGGFVALPRHLLLTLTSASYQLGITIGVPGALNDESASPSAAYPEATAVETMYHLRHLWVPEERDAQGAKGTPRVPFKSHNVDPCSPLHAVY